MSGVSKPERIVSAKVASILGIPVQTVRAMAARGQLPSAAKMGRNWTFSETAIRTWLRDREAAQQLATKIHQEWLNRSPRLEAYELAIGRKPSRLRSDDAPAPSVVIDK